MKQLNNLENTLKIKIKLNYILIVNKTNTSLLNRRRFLK